MVTDSPLPLVTGLPCAVAAVTGVSLCVVVQLKTRQGCEYLMQYDTESIIGDWFKVMQETVRQLEIDHLSEDEDDASDREDRDRRRTRESQSSLTAAWASSATCFHSKVKIWSSNREG